MESKEWKKFGELLGKIVNMDKPTYQEKKAELDFSAEEYDFVGELLEMLAWYDTPKNA